MAELIETPLTVVHVISCAFLILVVLLQPGKSGGLGAFSGAAAQQVFGGRGAGNFLTKTTWIIAAVFFMTSLSLAYMSSTGDESLEELATQLEDAAHAKSAPEAKVRVPGKSADSEQDVRRALDEMMAGGEADEDQAAPPGQPSEAASASAAPSASGAPPAGAAAPNEAPKPPGKGVVPSPNPATQPVQPRLAPVPARPVVPSTGAAPKTQPSPPAPAQPVVPPRSQPAPAVPTPPRTQPAAPPAEQPAQPAPPAVPAQPAAPAAPAPAPAGEPEE